MRRRGGEPFFYLRADEPVLLRLRPEKEWALATFVAAALVLTPLQALAFAASTRLPLPDVESFRAVAIGVYLGLLVVAGLFAWRRWATTEYALTDTRLYSRTGKLRVRVHFTTHDRITDITYRQGPLERLFGINRLTVSTAGGDVSVLGIRDAIALKEQVESARETFLQRLLEKAGLDEEARASASAARATAARSAAAASASTVAPTGDRAAAAEGAWDVAEETPAPAPTQRPLPPAPPSVSAPRPGYIKAGDKVLWHGKPRLIAAASSLVGLAGILPFVIISSLSRRGEGGAFFTLPIIFVIAAGLVAFRVLALRRIEYVVTDRRVYARSGIFGTTVSQLTYDKITDITYRQDLLGRLFGYGGVTVNTAGSNQAPVAMIGLAYALEAQALLEAARGRYLHEEDDA